MEKRLETTGMNTRHNSILFTEDQTSMVLWPVFMISVSCNPDVFNEVLTVSHQM